MNLPKRMIILVKNGVRAMIFYQYPPNKIVSPFDPVDADNYFAVAGETSYLGNFDELGNINDPFDLRNDFFKGAFVLGIMKRHSIVEDGALIYKNALFNDGHEYRGYHKNAANYIIHTNVLHRYIIDSWGGRFLETYTIKNDSGSYNCALRSKTFSTPDLAIQYAIQISSVKKMKCVIALLFAEIDRH